MRRRGLIVGPALAVAGLAAGVAWVFDGRHAFAVSIEILAPVGVVTALAADLIAARPALLGGIRGQLAALAALIAVQLGTAVALFAGLMFVSGHDALLMALVAAYAGLVGLGAARLVARRALSDLGAIRAALAEVGEGRRDLHIPVRGGDELAALASDVESMTAKIAAEERARRQLVAAISHDLRTPVTTLQLIAEGLEDGIFEPAQGRAQLRLMSTHVRALGALIEDLLELSRLESGPISWSMTRHLRLDELVRETVEAMRVHADANGIAVRAELGERLTAASGNPEQLQRVLFNLLHNAIRHTPPDGNVVVRAERVAGSEIEVEVSDSGSGIDIESRERMFEPFVQGPSRVSGENGSAGLGLAIARAIVEAHGGRIWLADSASDAGTQVRFSLPSA
ncbi:MAG: HAMP domain-containing histidine kinase [Solirubrobacterales bacterium]|nr:HAMP domain-containing histidine kinase [Solirubrobacterales bacterium]